VILDEATAIKGFKAKRSKKVKALDPEFAVALTGTPLENRPEEVYSIMEFVCPGYLGDFEALRHQVHRAQRLRRGEAVQEPRHPAPEVEQGDEPQDPAGPRRGPLHAQGRPARGVRLA
jgi:SNF2 family DNA or RNA helicase